MIAALAFYPVITGRSLSEPSINLDGTLPEAVKIVWTT
jgi:hypothetical protein